MDVQALLRRSKESGWACKGPDKVCDIKACLWDCLGAALEHVLCDRYSHLDSTDVQLYWGINGCV